MKFMFIIQGEGKGHLSQALVLKKWLEASGHSVSSVFMGRNIPGKRISYAKKELETSLKYFFSPGLIRNPSRRGILPLTSVLLNVMLIPVYMVSVFRLAIAMRQKDVERIVNFYDPLAGFSRLIAGKKKKMFSLGHHFYQGRHVPQKLRALYFRIFLLRMLNFFCSMGSVILALTFSREEEELSEPDSFYYVPPILDPPSAGCPDKLKPFVLVYFLNPGFTPDLITMAAEHPDLLFRLYTGSLPSPESIPFNLSVSLPERADFMRDMDRATAVICTAGFETLCEALFRRLPLYIVPSEGHFEQLCNAEEVREKGLAGEIPEFPHFHFDPAHANRVREWYLQGKEIILSLLCT